MWDLKAQRDGEGEWIDAIKLGRSNKAPEIDQLGEGIQLACPLKRKTKFIREGNFDSPSFFYELILVLFLDKTPYAVVLFDL